jgi:hypothetical protein
MKVLGKKYLPTPKEQAVAENIWAEVKDPAESLWLTPKVLERENFLMVRGPDANGQPISKEWVAANLLIMKDLAGSMPF